MWVCMYVCTYVCMYVCRYVCTYVCMYVGMYVCMYLPSVLTSSLATGWTVQGSNTGGCEIFLARPARPRGPPSLLRNGYRVFPGGKTPGRDAGHPPPSSAEVANGLEPYLRLHSVPA